MTYDLAIGDRSYSSWSLRGWLLFARFGLPVTVHTGVLYTNDFTRLLGGFAPARQVPAMRTPDGEVVGETIAIAETLHERHPEAGIWPEDPAARAMARYMAAEMHAGFTALRGDCPMNLRDQLHRLRAEARGSGRSGPDRGDLGPRPRAVRRDRPRGQPLAFRRATRRPTPSSPRSRPGSPPTTCRSRCRPRPMSPPISPTRPSAAGGRWAGRKAWIQPSYCQTLPRTPLARPGAAAGRDRRRAIGKPRLPLFRQAGQRIFCDLDGRVWGFCNRFCRDKTLADPEAWPAFMAMLAR